MLQKENNLGCVKLVEVPGSKGKRFGLPFPSTINRTSALDRHNYYAEYISVEDAILITPHECTEIPRISVITNKSHSCFVMPKSLINEISDSHDDIIHFSVYRCYEDIVKKCFTLKLGNPSSTMVEVDILDSGSSLEDELDKLVKLYPKSNISIQVFERIDALLYKKI